MIKQIEIRGFDSNFSYFVGDSATKEVAIVDPDDVDFLMAQINHFEYIPKMILLTHSHFDHVAGVGQLTDEYGIPVYMHTKAKSKLEVEENFVNLIEDGDVIKIGGLEIEVLYTPGHIDDAVCYYISKESAEDGIPKVLTGDTLFVEGCGRADLAGSNIEELYHTMQKLKKLPNETEVYPGHDYGSKTVSTIDWEKEHNKYMQCGNLEEFVEMRK